MKSESLVYAAAGTLVGFLGGWIIGSQHTIAGAPAAAIATPAPTSAAPANAPTAPPLDSAKVQAATGTQAASVYELHTNTGYPTQVDHGAYRIRLTAVAPGPHVNVTIDPAAYVITLIVTRP